MIFIKCTIFCDVFITSYTMICMCTVFIVCIFCIFFFYMLSCRNFNIFRFGKFCTVEICCCSKFSNTTFCTVIIFTVVFRNSTVNCLIKCAFFFLGCTVKFVCCTYGTGCCCCTAVGIFTPCKCRIYICMICYRFAFLKLFF